MLDKILKSEKALFMLGFISCGVLIPFFALGLAVFKYGILGYLGLGVAGVLGGMALLAASESGKMQARRDKEQEEKNMISGE